MNDKRQNLACTLAFNQNLNEVFNHIFKNKISEQF